MLRNALQKRLRFENLEPKMMLAGDVAIAVVGGDLIITGDADINELELVNGAVAGEYTIEDRGPVGGTLNGQDVDMVTVTGVTGDVLVDLLGNDDDFRVLDADLPGDLRVKGGDGNDELFIGIPENPLFLIPLPVTIGDDLSFDGGAGADTFFLRDFTIADDLSFKGRDGDDIFLMEPDLPLSTGSSVGDDVYVRTGAGIDEISLEAVTIGDKVRISAGADNDSVFVVDTVVGRSILIGLGSGVNESEIEAVDAGRSLTILGHGTNMIALADVTSTHFLTILTASGDDLISMEGVTTSSALVATHGGADDVSIIDSAFDQIAVLLGSGDDTLTIGGVTVNRFAIFSGGSGDDTLVDAGDNDINFELDFGFENFV